MKLKRVSRIAFVVIAVLIVGQIGSNTLFRWAAAKAIRRIPPMMAPYGVSVAHIYFDGARMEGLRRYVVTDLRTLVNARDGEGEATATFRAARLEVDVLSYTKKEIVFGLNHFHLAFDDSAGARELPFTRLENATWERQTPVAWRDLPAAVKDVLGKIEILFTENKIDRPFRFQGDVVITIAGKTARARLFSEAAGGFTTLKFDAADIRAAAEVFAIPLAPAEVDILATYPLRTLDLMKIAHTARETARNTAVTQATVPQDAYRHVLWSYLLTRRFGPDFAREVTDAHETAPGNSPAEHDMDYNNNAVGRRYAAEGVAPEALLDILMKDPAVITSPEDAGAA